MASTCSSCRLQLSLIARASVGAVVHSMDERPDTLAPEAILQTTTPLLNGYTLAVACTSFTVCTDKAFRHFSTDRSTAGSSAWLAHRAWSTRSL